MEKPPPAPTGPPDSKERIHRELLMIIAKHLEESNLQSVADRLAMKARLYIDRDHILRLVMNEKWKKVEKYLRSFHPLSFSEHSPWSSEILSFIRRQRFLQFLHRGDTLSCVVMLRELHSHPTLLAELSAALLHGDSSTLEALKDHPLSEENKKTLFQQLSSSIENHPQLSRFLTKPVVNERRLRQLINQSLNWQHEFFCKPRLPKQWKGQWAPSSLLSDHRCEGLQDQAPASPPLSPGTSSGDNSASLARVSSVSGPQYAPSASTTNKQFASELEKLKQVQHDGRGDTTSCREPDSNLQTRVSSKTPLVASPMPLPAPSAPRETSLASSPIASPPASSVPCETALTSSPTASTPASSAPFETSLAPSPLATNSSQIPSIDVLRELLFNECAEITPTVNATIKAVAFRPQLSRRTSRILIGFSSGEVGLWEIKYEGKWRERSRLLMMIKDECIVSAVSSLAWCGASQFAAGHQSGEIVLYHYDDATRTAKKERVLKKHTDMVFRVLFSPYQSNTLLSCSRDSRIIEWNTQNGTVKRMYQHDGPVFGVMTGQKDMVTYILATGKSGIKCFCGGSVVPFKTLPENKYCTDIRSVGERIFSCGPLLEGVVEWRRNSNDYEPLRFKGYAKFEKDGPLPRIEVVMDSYLAVASKQGVHLWDCSATTPTVKSIVVPGENLINGDIRGIAYGSGLLAVYSRRCVTIWGPKSLSSSKNKRPREKSDSGPPSVAGSESTVIAPTIPTTTVTGVNLPPARPPRSISSLADLPSRALHLRYVAKSADIVALDAGGSLRIWRIGPQGTCPALELPLSDIPIISSSFGLTSNEFFALAVVGKRFLILDLRNRTVKVALDIRPGFTTLATFPEDNNIWALGNDEGNIHIYMRELKQPSSLLDTGHPVQVSSIAFASVDLLLAADVEGRIYLSPWKQKSTLMTEFFVMPGHSDTPVHIILNETREIAMIYSSTEIGLFQIATKTWKTSRQMPGGVKLVTAVYVMSERVIVCGLDNGTLLSLGAEDLSAGTLWTLPERISCLTTQPLGFMVGGVSGKIYQICV